MGTCPSTRRSPRPSANWAGPCLRTSLLIQYKHMDNEPKCLTCGEREEHLNHYADYTLDGEIYWHKDHDFVSPEKHEKTAQSATPILRKTAATLRKTNDPDLQFIAKHLKGGLEA